MHQDHALTGALRVVHNANGGRLGEWPTWRALASLVVPGGRAEVEAALAAVGAGGLADERTDELSGGQRQRVANRWEATIRETVVVGVVGAGGLGRALDQELSSFAWSRVTGIVLALIAVTFLVDAASTALRRRAG